MSVKLSYRKAFLITVIVYFILVFVVGPDGEFPVNDDWLFVRQVEAFQMGKYKINALIDPSFIVQGLIGLLWSSNFGVGFVSLRTLTILITPFFIYGVYKILKLLKINPKLALVLLLLVVFNPVIFTSSLTFMTEIYFMTFFVWGLYYYLHYFEKRNPKFLILGSVFCALSMLIRHVGLILFISLVISCISDLVKRKDGKVLNELILASVPVLVGILVWGFWPRHATESFGNLIELKYLPRRIYSIYQIAPLLAYFLSPILLLHFKGLDSKIKKRLLFVSVIWVFSIYNLDIFPLGNIFYVEGFYTKSNFRSNLSLFDNIPFKIFLAYFVSLNITILFYLAYEHFKKFDKDKLNKYITNKLGVLLGVLGLTSFAMLFVSSDLYDRYLMPLFLVLLLFLVKTYKFKKLDNLRLVGFSLLLIGFMTTVLSYEFYTVYKLKWQQVRNIQGGRLFRTQIYLDGTYTKYVYAKNRKDYMGLLETMPGGVEYRCYVQQYTVDGESGFFKAISSLDHFLEKYIAKPRIYGSKKDRNVKRAKKHLADLSYNAEYFSPIYSIIGKKAFVGSWCD